jgi:O-acetyl-ADP-ribose deacetylase (regulator of RNase III)
MIKFVTGDIFESGAEALVNPVNAVGISGKGLALDFKENFPENFENYKWWCSDNNVKAGDIIMSYGIPMIFNAVTKKHWKDNSSIETIELVLKNLYYLINNLKLKSIAIPALGCGCGGLDWEIVKPMFNCLNDLHCEILVYEPKEKK